MVIFSAIFVASLPFLFFFNSLKLYRNFKLVKLAAKGFIETIKKLRDWQEKIHTRQSLTLNFKI